MRLFVFFKQKTAYEMRISDWSSDVCSSDLAPEAGGSRQPDALGQLADRDPPVGLQGAENLAVDRIKERVRHFFARNCENAVDFARYGSRFNAMRQENPLHRRILGRRQSFGRQIGRASCRERVCQYV